MRFLKIICQLSIIFLLIGCSANENKTRIFLAGDSTMSEKLDEKRPETGWGEKLEQYFNGEIEVVNLAKNGRSTRTFISEGRWQALIDSLSAGDYVFIQFGHNDQSKHKTDRYTPPEDYSNNLKRFVEDARAKRAIPVLLTSVMRRRFDEQGEFYDVHGVYPDLVREIAKEMNVYLIDHHRSSEKLFIKLGEEGTKKLFLHLKPGENLNYPEGRNDNTHFNDYGAGVIAKLVADEIAGSEIPLKKYINKGEENDL